MFRFLASIPGLMIRLVRSLLTGRVTVAAENLALRQQLAALQRKSTRPQLSARDRLFWVLLARWFRDWRSWLVIVQPDTVVRWHRQGFRLFWRWKSRGRPGRPTIPRDVQALIRRIARDNPLWGVPRIRAELHMLGHDLAESTVAKYAHRPRKPPSPTWKAFLTNHAHELASIDFFTVPTVTFRNLYVVVLRHDRRRIFRVGVTDQPHAVWVARQSK